MLDKRENMLQLSAFAFNTLHTFHKLIQAHIAALEGHSPHFIIRKYTRQCTYG